MCYTKKIGEKYASFSIKRFFYFCPYRPIFDQFFLKKYVYKDNQFSKIVLLDLFKVEYINLKIGCIIDFKKEK